MCVFLSIKNCAGGQGGAEDGWVVLHEKGVGLRVRYLDFNLNLAFRQQPSKRPNPMRSLMMTKTIEHDCALIAQVPDVMQV